MKTVISATGPSLDSEVDPNLGRSRYFLVYEDTTGLHESLPNPYRDDPGAAGVKAAERIVATGASRVITGRIGAAVRSVLTGASIDLVENASGTVRNALNASPPLARDISGNAPQADRDPLRSFSLGSVPMGMPRPGHGPGTGAGRGFVPDAAPARFTPDAAPARGNPAGQCVCTGCGHTMPDDAGLPCFKHRCPSCGCMMERRFNR